MNIEQARINMIKQQLRTSYVLDEQILNAIIKIPREEFVPRNYKKLAFADMNIPLGHDQVMFTPMEEALILQALKLKPDEIVLEIGTGSGYMTALLAHFSRIVYSVEIFPDFCADAQRKLAQHQINNVAITEGDAAAGWEEQMPYDVIVISGSLPFLPDSFKNSIRVGGRIFVILGKKPAMEATVFTYTQSGQWQEQKLFETVIPPLVNALQPPDFVF